jgi:hypothetical protein
VWCLAGALAVVAGPLLAEATAADTRIMHASGCARQSAIVNFEGVTMSAGTPVLCPLERDSTTSSLQSVEVRFHPETWPQVTCTAMSVSRFGTSIRSTSSSDVTIYEDVDPGGNWFVMGYGISMAGFAPIDSRSTYLVRCDPSASGAVLTSVHWDE